MKKAFLILTLVGVTFSIHAQFLDKFGINAGAGLASQRWKYHLNSVEYNFDQTSMIGKSAVISCEKKLSRTLTIRPEMGYMQKGFKSTRKLVYNGFEVPEVMNKNVVLNDVVFNLGLKIVPMDRNLNPYVVLGLQVDYMLSFTDVVYHETKMWTSVLENFNKVSFDGILAAGLEYRNKVYLEAVYIPSITSRYTKDRDSVKDSYIGLTLGVNIKYYPIKKIYTRHKWYTH